MESLDWWISAYTHQYASNWSGFDPCTISYEIVDAESRQVLSLSSTGNRLLSLATDDPTLVGVYTPTIRAFYSVFTDRSTPT
jgi:hypothetical protein